MNQIKSIRISNYKSCINTDLELNESLSVLIGINGVGKTNILNALSILGNIEIEASDIKKNNYEPISGPSTITATLVVDKQDVDIKLEFYLEFDEVSENVRYKTLKYKFPTEKTWKVIEHPYFDYSRFVFRRNRPKDQTLIKSHFFREDSAYLENFELKNKILKFLDKIAYFSATQFADPTKSPSSLEQRGDRIRPSTYSSNSKHYSFLADLYAAFQDKEAFIRFINVVGPRGLSLVEDITFEPIKVPSVTYKVSIGGRLQNYESIRTIIVPRVTIDGLPLSFSQLSEGTFKTLGLVFYILNSKKRVLIIEEPEVCVHYGLLASLMELIKGETHDKQIILSTHSDFILDKIKPENLIIVKKEREQGTIARPLEKAMAKNDYRYLKEYLHETGNLGEFWRESGFMDE